MRDGDVVLTGELVLIEGSEARVQGDLVVDRDIKVAGRLHVQDSISCLSLNVHGADEINKITDQLKEMREYLDRLEKKVEQMNYFIQTTKGGDFGGHVKVLGNLEVNQQCYLNDHVKIKKSLTVDELSVHGYTWQELLAELKYLRDKIKNIR